MSDKPVTRHPGSREHSPGRSLGWYRVERAVAERYAGVIGPVALGIYYAILSHANAERRCWPSYGRLAKVSGYKRLSAIRGVRTLKKHGLIEVKTIFEEGKRPFNIYTVLDPDEGAPVTQIKRWAPYPLPVDWQPTAHQMSWAREQGLGEEEIERATLAFVVNYTTKNAGYQLPANEWDDEWGDWIRYPP